MLHIPNQEFKKVLLESGFIDEKQFNGALEEAQKTGRALNYILIEHGDISEEYLAEILAEYFKVQYVDLDKIKINEEVLHLISEQVAKTKKIVPFELAEEGLKIAMEDPGDLDAINFIEKQTGKNIVPYIATSSDIRESLGLYKKSIAQDFTKIIEENVQKSHAQGMDVEQMAKDLPVINILNTLIEYAIAQRASDIHIEALPQELIVRFRIDGVLRDVITLPLNVHPAIVARVKILSDLKIDEHRLPQDGRFRFDTESHSSAIRVSIVPDFYGEKVVMRLLEESERFLNLEDLGLSQHNLELVQQAIKEPHGMVLSTGPTCSGKTTSLYTVLHMLNRQEVNISTVEDPIEYDIKRINQIQINPKINLTFADGLRSLLRQDPDIIMVGEIRDKETADMAIHSALTGHLLLSTLHTNNAAGAIPRLIDMGVEPFLLASTLNLIIAQRLVRRICTNCVTSVKLTEEQRNKIALTVQTINPNLALPNHLYKGKGCRQCSNSGYKGRIGIFEILPVTPKIQDLVTARVPEEKIFIQAVKDGMTTMLQDGFSKVEAGTTTLEEVLRVTRE